MVDMKDVEFTDLPTPVQEDLTVQEFFGKPPVQDFSKEWTRMLGAISERNRDETVRRSFKAQRLAGVIVSSNGGNLVRLDELFDQIRYYAMTGRFTTCRIPIEELTELFE